jgi:predicted phosphodiesterase
MCVISACGISSVVTPTQPPLIQPSATLTVVINDSESVPRSTSTQIPQPTVPLVLEPGGGAYSIPLHVQHKTSHELVLMFELEEAQEGKVYWWAEGSSFRFASSLIFSSDQSKHLITINGLIPGQEYHVVASLPGDDGLDRLPTFKDEMWDPIEVRMLTDGSLPLTIGVFGDSGFGEGITSDLASQLSSHDPDFVIHTGDLVYLANQEGSPKIAYQKKWYQTLADLVHTTVIYPVVGNHEYDGDARLDGIPYYFEAFPMLEQLAGGWRSAPEGIRREWYALELDSLQILFLNTQQFYGGTARQEQDTWLSARLVDDRFAATVVVFHVPPLTSGRHSLDGAVVLGSWVPAFESSNVVLVLSGHDHNYERLERNGITYLVSGGGSSVLYPLEARLAESQSFAVKTHYVLLEIDSDQIQLEAFDLDGGIIDAATIDLGH